MYLYNNASKRTFTKGLHLFFAAALIAGLALSVGPAPVMAQGPTTVTLPGGSLTTAPGAYQNAVQVYPYKWDVTQGDLTIEGTIDFGGIQARGNTWDPDLADGDDWFGLWTQIGPSKGSVFNSSDGVWMTTAEWTGGGNDLDTQIREVLHMQEEPGTQPPPRLFTAPRTIVGGDGDDTHTFKLQIHSTGATTGWAKLWIDGNLVKEGLVEDMSYTGEDLSCAYVLVGIMSGNNPNNPAHTFSWSDLTVTGYPAISYTIDKKVTPTGPVVPGNTITYTIAITNSGVCQSTNAVISDTLSAGLTFAGPVTLDPPGAGTPGTAPPILASGLTINAGESITLTFPVTVSTCLAAGTVLTNTVAVTSTEVAESKTISKTITVANAPPVAVDDTATTDEDTPVTIDVVTNDSDPNCDALSIADVGIPANGTATISDTTTVVYTPTLNFNGSDVFTYTVSDTGGLTDTATVSVTVTIGPRPDVTIAKNVTPSTALPGQTITYTLTFSNADVGPATGVVISDVVPVSVTVQSVVSSGVAITDTGLSPGLVWNVQDLAPSEGGVITIYAQLDPSIATTTTLTNTVEITCSLDATLANNTAQAPITVNAPPELKDMYLPIILQNHVYGPDLVVESIVATSNNVQVVIKNQGDRHVPATHEFWVDFYVNPNPPPTGVNQTWSDGRSTEGMVWGVTASALPLAPGDTLILTNGDAYYWPSLSNFSGSLAAGTPVYAQVDSANTLTTYGAVLENHEISGGPYNNIASTLSVMGQGPAAEPPARGEALPASSGNLPPRP